MVPGLAGLFLVGLATLLGRPTTGLMRDVATAWYRARPPWQVGAGLLLGVALWVFVGGDAGAAAMAAVIPGPAGGSGRIGAPEPRAVMIAESDRGLVLVTDPTAVASALAKLPGLCDRGEITQGDREVLSPSGLWEAVHLRPVLADDLDATDGVAVPGLRQVRDWLVVHPRGDDLDRTLDTAASYRVLGAPSMSTWPAVVAEDVRAGNEKVVLRAGERVEVARYRGGRPVDLDDPVQRAQVARLLAAAAALGDIDVRAVKVANLVRDRAGNVGLVDFGAGMKLDSFSAEAQFRIVIDGAPHETRAARKVFGALTEADLLAGYRYVVERRVELLAVIGDPGRRLLIGARLDWMGEVVRDGRLPDWLREELEEARRVAARAHPGERLAGHAYRLGFSPEQTDLVSGALARILQENPAPRPDGSDSNRDPPVEGLREGETLLVFRRERLVAELGGPMPDGEAADVVERLVMFAFHHADGLVVAIEEERLAELVRLGALVQVIDGARRRASRIPPSELLERLRSPARPRPGTNR